MLVERTSKEVIVRLPVSVSFEDLQDFLNYTRYNDAALANAIQKGRKTALLTKAEKADFTERLKAVRESKKSTKLVSF